MVDGVIQSPSLLVVGAGHLGQRPVELLFWQSSVFCYVCFYRLCHFECQHTFSSRDRHTWANMSKRKSLNSNQEFIWEHFTYSSLLFFLCRNLFKDPIHKQKNKEGNWCEVSNVSHIYFPSPVFFFWCVHLCYAHIQIRTHQQKARSKQSNLKLSKLLQGLSQLSLKSRDIYVKQKGKLFSARRLQQDISVTGHWLE